MRRVALLGVLPCREGDVAAIYSPPGMCWGIAGVSHGVSEGRQEHPRMWREAPVRPWDAQALAEIQVELGWAPRAIKEEKPGCFVGFLRCLWSSSTGCLDFSISLNCIASFSPWPMERAQHLRVAIHSVWRQVARAASRMPPSAPVQADIPLVEMQHPHPDNFELPVTAWSRRCSNGYAAPARAGRGDFSCLISAARRRG